MDLNKIHAELLKKIDADNICLNEYMSKHTSFKIGGPADIFVKPKNINQLRHILAICNSYHVPWFILGNGSNLLVKDQGFRGLIIQMYRNFNNIEINDNIVIAESGILLSTMAKKIASSSLKGFEFASGIPGTLGGAVYMNAGAYDGEMKDVLTSVKIMDEKGNTSVININDLKMGYRTSILQKNKCIIISAKMKFELGYKEEIYKKIQELNNRRRKKQPLEKSSAGSTFKRPKGYFAGKLIMDAGLKGYSIGDAQVSEKHCGFVVNNGKASAEDVINLIKYICKTIYDKFGVVMNPEVRILGEYGLEKLKFEI